MTKFGTAGIPNSSIDNSTEGGIEEIRRLRLDCMEVQFVQGVRMSIEHAKNIGILAKNLNVELSCHAPYFINFASDELAKRKNSVKFVVDTARVGNFLNAKFIVFHCGFYSKRESTYDLIKRGILECKEIIKQNKWNVKLAPETMGNPTKFGTLEEILSLCKETNCSPTIDFAHIHSRTFGSLNSQERFSKILDKIEKELGSNVLKELHIHFTGVEYSKGNERRHLTLEEGDLKFEYLANEIVRRKLSPTIISESPNLEVDALKMKKIYENLCLSLTLTFNNRCRY